MFFWGSSVVVLLICRAILRSLGGVDSVFLLGVAVSGFYVVIIQVVRLGLLSAEVVL